MLVLVLVLENKKVIYLFEYEHGHDYDRNRGFETASCAVYWVITSHRRREVHMMNHNCWQGEKVKLRAVEMRDMKTFASWEQDTETAQYFDAIHFPLSAERLHGRVASLARAEGKDDGYYWIIENLDGQAVGLICTYACNRRCGTFRYGVIVTRSYWGRGYAGEAIRIVLRFYFRELGYQKVIAGIYAFNERSLQLHEHLGFRQEGRLRRMIYTNGEYHDEYLLGMLREEFEENDEIK